MDVSGTPGAHLGSIVSHPHPAPPLLGLPSLLGHVLTIGPYSQQPWCTYALHIATFTSLAFMVDPFLLVSCWWATEGWDSTSRRYALWSQFIFMFAFTKVVKLMGLFLRNPGDVKFLPVSILFGYFHGLIKLYALCTLRMVGCLRLLKWAGETKK